MDPEPMKFAHEKHKATYERVHDYMVQLYGESAWAAPDGPYFVVHGGSATVLAAVDPWGEDATVSVFSWVVTEVEESPELLRYLLAQNFDKLFGGFAIDGRKNVLYKYTLFGQTLDKEELAIAVQLVLSVADSLDDEIIGQFGGLSAKDRVPPGSR